MLTLSIKSNEPATPANSAKNEKPENRNNEIVCLKIQFRLAQNLPFYCKSKIDVAVKYLTYCIYNVPDSYQIKCEHFNLHSYSLRNGCSDSLIDRRGVGVNHLEGIPWMIYHI